MRNLLRVIHILLLFSACSEEAVTSKKVFRFNMETPLNSLDPAFARDQMRIWATSQFYSGLVQLDSQMEVAPSLAYRWEILDSGKVYRFYLRNDVHFHNAPCFPENSGREVIADDFVWSLQRLIDPATASPGAWIFNDKVEGPEAFRAINDSVFEIRLKQSFPPLLGMLSMPYCFVIPKEAVEYYKDDFRAHPVGTGAFQFVFWEEGIKLIGERNPNYYEKENGKALPFLDGFEVSFIENKQTAFLEFVQGKLDFFSGLEGSYKDELLTRSGTLREHYDGKFQLRRGPYLNTEYLGFMIDSNVKLEEHNPLLNKSLRKALSFAVNREEMMRFLRNNIGTPGNGGFIPDGLPGHQSQIGYGFNKDSALYYLHQSDYKGETILLYTNKNYLDLTVYVQRMWKEIGVNSKIEVNPGPFHREQVSKSRFMCFRASWLADYPDAENYLSLFYQPNFAPNGPNYTHFQSSSFDSLYLAAMQTDSPEERVALYKEMDALMLEEAPVLILFYDQTLQLLSNRVSFLSTNAMNQLLLKNAIIH